MFNKKGISLISLIVTIIVMLIISSALVYTGINNAKVEKISKMNADIDAVRKSVDVYYLKNNTVPVEFDGQNKKILNISQVITVLSSDRDLNDSDIYYIVDLSYLENLTLSGATKGGKFIVNSNTHNVYYINAESMAEIG